MLPWYSSIIVPAPCSDSVTFRFPSVAMHAAHKLDLGFKLGCVPFLDQTMPVVRATLSHASCAFLETTHHSSSRSVATLHPDQSPLFFRAAVTLAHHPLSIVLQSSPCSCSHLHGTVPSPMQSRPCWLVSCWVQTWADQPAIAYMHPSWHRAGMWSVLSVIPCALTDGML